MLSQSLNLADLLRPFPDIWQEQQEHFGFGKNQSS